MSSGAWWKTWGEVNALSIDRDIVLYGRSEDWIPKTLKKLDKYPQYIVDMNDKYMGTSYNELSVFLPKKLLVETTKVSRPYVVITSGVYEGIVKILLDNGFVAGADFACCPEYQDYQLLENMRNYSQQVVVSSSDYNDKEKSRYSKAGGGIYLYTIGLNEVEKKITGSFRQMVKVDELIYAIEYVEALLYVFDCDFKVVEKHPLDAANYCGLDYNKKRDVFVMINAGQDTISIYQRTPFKLINRIAYSEKAKLGYNSAHHLNDVCTTDDSIYVSYFSHSGNWKVGNYDGGVSEYRFDALDSPPVRLVSNLWKPHSPKILNGDLCYLDSMRGRLYTTNQVVAGEFHGFARGLAYDGRFYYIGLSEDMYMSRRFGTTSNIMLNAGFYMFDKDTKASRFYPMLDNMNIHDLLVLDA